MATGPILWQSETKVSPDIEVINSYSYSGGRVIEVRFNTISSGADKKYAYQWYLIHAYFRSDLRFISHLGHLRKFEFTCVHDHTLTWMLELNTEEMRLCLTHNKSMCPCYHDIVDTMPK